MLIAASVATLALGISLASAGSGGFALRAAPSEGGPFRATAKIHLTKGSTKTAWLRLKSKLEQDQPVRLSTNSPPYDSFKVAWFRGDKNITGKVENGGYVFQLPGDGTRLFSMRVKRTQGSANQTCIGATVQDAALFATSHTEVGVNTQCLN